MKEFSKNKRGISLIVLVITIIVMIILAAAIILALNSSDIIGKANEAVTKSDLANAKSVVAIAQGEWELMSKSQQETEGGFVKYAAKKLREAGFSDNYAATEDGEVVTGTAAVIVSNNVEKGAEVKGYTLTEKTYTTDGSEHDGYVYIMDEGYNPFEKEPVEQTLKTDTDMTWRYVGLDEDGNVLIAPDMPTNVPDTSMIEIAYTDMDEMSILDTIAEELYSNNMGTAENIKLEHAYDILEYTGKREFVRSVNMGDSCTENFEPEELEIKSTDTTINVNRTSLIFYDTTYWFSDTSDYTAASSCFMDDEEYGGEMGLYGNKGFNCSKTSIHELWVWEGECGVLNTAAIRPIVTLNSNVEATYDSSAKTITLK